MGLGLGCGLGCGLKPLHLAAELRDLRAELRLRELAPLLRLGLGLGLGSGLGLGLACLGTRGSVDTPWLSRSICRWAWPHLNGQRRGSGRLWRRLAVAPEAVVGRLVGRFLP